MSIQVNGKAAGVADLGLESPKFAPTKTLIQLAALAVIGDFVPEVSTILDGSNGSKSCH